MNFLICLLKKIFIYLHLWKIFFLDINSDLITNYLWIVLWPEVSYNPYSSICYVSFSSLCLQGLSLVLVVNNLHTICWGILPSFRMCDLWSIINFGKSSVINSSSIFSTLFSFSFPSGIPITHIRTFDTVQVLSDVLGRFVFFFFLPLFFSFYVSVWVISIN